jgi:uncharacterized protein YtpQ (UPF0354 family)
VKTTEVLSHVLPQFFPAHWLDPPGPIYRDFPSRIRIGYVLRGEGQYSYIVDADFATLSITLDELHAAALANLARLPSASISIGKVPGGAEGWIWATDDNFAAARILLPEVQENFREALGREFLVSLPHRDDCFCWSLAQSKERHEKHAQEVLQAFLQEQYNLTPDILLYSQGSFRIHRKQVVGEPGAASNDDGK